MMLECTYDDSNILARVLRRELPAEVAYENRHCLIISDIRPQAPFHFLALPKGSFVCFGHFMSGARPEEVLDFLNAVNDVVNGLNLSPVTGGNGYRLIANTGTDGFQEIAHYHMHIVAGRWLGPLLPEDVDIETAVTKFPDKPTKIKLT